MTFLYDVVAERHRHRYAVNTVIYYVDQLLKKNGLVIAKMYSRAKTFLKLFRTPE